MIIFGTEVPNIIALLASCIGGCGGFIGMLMMFIHTNMVKRVEKIENNQVGVKSCAQCHETFEKALDSMKTDIQRYGRCQYDMNNSIAKIEGMVSILVKEKCGGCHDEENKIEDGALPKSITPKM